MFETHHSPIIFFTIEQNHCNGKSVEPNYIIPDETINEIKEHVIYPNPAYDQVYFKTENNSLKFELYNSLGEKQFITFSNERNIFKLDISNLNTGVYFLKLSTGENLKLVIL